MTQQLDKINFIKIDERSPICSLISPPSINITSMSNAEIRFGCDFELYLKSLSKSVRQNIRTAYNRCDKDGHQIDLKVFHGGDKMFPIKEIIGLYCKRHETKYDVKNSILRRWFLENQSFATRMYRYSSNALTICLRIDDKIAAFLSGLYNKERIIVPRLSIDDSFRRYSPGMILVCEAVKYMISNTSIRVLDLSHGKEQYKYQLGAAEHFSYSFSL